LLNRRDAVAEQDNSKAEDLGWKFWKTGMLKRSRMDMVGGGIKNFLLKSLFRNIWGKHRSRPEVAPKSFAKLWEEKNNEDKKP
jgi:L-lactate dehydrogenase complex protein LldF